MRLFIASPCSASVLVVLLVLPFATSFSITQTGHPGHLSTPVHREIVLEGGTGASAERARRPDAAPSGSDVVQAVRAGERLSVLGGVHAAKVALARGTSTAVAPSLWDVVERVDGDGNDSNVTFDGVSSKMSLSGAGDAKALSDGTVDSKGTVDRQHSGPDVFDEVSHAGDIDWGTRRDWSYFFVCAVVLFCVDFFILHRVRRTVWAHAGLGVFWWVVAAVYAVSVAVMDSRTAAKQWVIGYLLEWMLSLDNLLVFHVVFKVYRTPVALQPKALLAGIFGAVVFRFVFFLGLSRLMEAFTVVRVFFGACLIVSGVKVVRGDDDDFDPETSPSVRWLSYFLSGRLDSSYDAAGSFLRYDAKEGRNKLTLLAFVVVVVELTDILFACDSVSAKAGQFSNVYLNLSSSVIAMFGLRSAFFVVKDLIDAFVLLEYGLCTVLVFVGLELCVSPWVDIPPQIGVMVIIAVFVTCIVGSLAMKMRMDGQTREDVSNAP